jgi:DNA-binding HxlR family transcriptional regulator
MPDDPDFCPITAATDLLGQKWTLLIVHYLHAEAPHRLRFCELQQRLGGLNPATLSARLKRLESEGLVERIEINQLALHVEYTLTRKGSDLGPVVENLYQWGDRWLRRRNVRRTSRQR